MMRTTLCEGRRQNIFNIKADGIKSNQQDFKRVTSDFRVLQCDVRTPASATCLMHTFQCYRTLYEHNTSNLKVCCLLGCGVVCQNTRRHFPIFTYAAVRSSTLTLNWFVYWIFAFKTRPQRNPKTAGVEERGVGGGEDLPRHLTERCHVTGCSWKIFVYFMMFLHFVNHQKRYFTWMYVCQT